MQFREPIEFKDILKLIKENCYCSGIPNAGMPVLISKHGH